MGISHIVILTIREIPAPPMASSQDPDKLLERYEALLSSKDAGNKGINDEMVKIVNELYKQKELTDEQYQIMLAHAQN